MCHDWFRINYFTLNLHLIIDILVYICRRSEFTIVRSLCWEITRNNSVNCFRFCPAVDKDCLHFRMYDASAPQPWRVQLVLVKSRLLIKGRTKFGHFQRKVGQNSNSQTRNHTPLQEHAHTSMLALHCSGESQVWKYTDASISFFQL